MKTIVRHKQSGQRYILVGTGFGISPSMKPSSMFGTISLTGDVDQESMVAVCETTGDIRWIRSEELQVVEIDGSSPDEILQQ